MADIQNNDATGTDAQAVAAITQLSKKIEELTGRIAMVQNDMNTIRDLMGQIIDLLRAIDATANMASAINDTGDGGVMETATDGDDEQNLTGSDSINLTDSEPVVVEANYNGEQQPDSDPDERDFDVLVLVGGEGGNNQHHDNGEEDQAIEGRHGA